MAHGGRRPGAGRKKGSLSRKTREIAEQVAATGTTPLEVMMRAMMAHYEAGRLDQAATIAKDAAPYIHPRLAAIDHSGEVATTFVMRAPEVVADAETWANKYVPPRLQ